MRTFEGICKFCGSIQPVMAESQEEANVLVSKSCTCAGAELEEKKEKLRQAIDDVAGEGCTIYGMRPMSEPVAGLLQDAGLMVMNGKISKITVGVDGVNITINLSAKGQVKVKRTEGRSVSAEC